MLQQLIKSLIVICVLLLAVGPMADSVICGLESGGVGSAELIADLDGDEDRDQPMADHAICAHGHCHHPVPLTGSAEVHTSANLYAEVDQPLLLALQPPSTSPPSLKRPPRV